MSTSRHVYDIYTSRCVYVLDVYAHLCLDVYMSICLCLDVYRLYV